MDRPKCANCQKEVTSGLFSYDKTLEEMGEFNVPEDFKRKVLKDIIRYFCSTHCLICFYEGRD